ncbi:hypothetical protein FX988_02856 [Paraglaciecola mesophila]|uniref:Uncharacterized protein n=1 Tax=Paraglaciecola mesophila TaxID=197222 RepID=A0A857JMP3_9ALTE|nr:hypothetical protein FX988_02856 [Paraglaciecola mesophila]
MAVKFGYGTYKLAHIAVVCLSIKGDVAVALFCVSGLPSGYCLLLENL